jgi:hypothetical protein
MIKDIAFKNSCQSITPSSCVNKNQQVSNKKLADHLNLCTRAELPIQISSAAYLTSRLAKKGQASTLPRFN